MSKLQRKIALSSYDLAIIVAYLKQHIVGTKINTINSSRASVVFKLHNPHNQEKPKLVITPQAMYTTKYEITSASAPTAFVQILRKELAGMHISAFTQVNFDRTVIIAFSTHKVLSRLLVVELFGKGNVVLTDLDYRVLASQSVYKRPVYEIIKSSNISDISGALSLPALKQFMETAKSAHGQQNQLRYVLANRYYIGGALASIILRQCELSAGIKCANPKVDAQRVFELTNALVNALMSGMNGKSAFIYYYPSDAVVIDAYVPNEVRKSLRAAEIHPIDLNEVFPGLYPPECVERVPNFLDGVDEYFNMLQTAEGHQNRVDLIYAQTAKHDRLQNDNAQKVVDLFSEAYFTRFLGSITLLNQYFVDSLLYQLEKMFQCGVLTWSSIAHEIGLQQLKVFNYIDSVQAAQKTFEVRVKVTTEQLQMLEYHSFAEIDSMKAQQEDPEADEVGLNEAERIYTVYAKLGDTAMTIASALFDQAKTMEEKAGRTIQHTDEAVAKIQRMSKEKIDKIMRETERELTILTKQKPQLWFEKFNWFFSSEGYLVLSGRDAQSNEMLVKRFMLENDVFVHADVHGAACTIIKAPSPGKLFAPPHSTLCQAACQTVTHSRLWETKVSAESYWVYGAQVSKTAPSGQFIGTGSFVIRGKRNFIDLTDMKLGISLLFRYDTPQEYFKQYQPAMPASEEGEQLPTAGQAFTIIYTKKAKYTRQSAEDAQKMQRKDQQRLKRKERQQNIAAMRFNAKIKRLKAEGREEDAEVAIQNKMIRNVEIEVEAQNFCFLCGGFHAYLDCDQNSSPEQPESDGNSEASIASENSSSVEYEAQDVQYYLLESAYVLSPIYDPEKRPQLCVQVAPLQALSPVQKRIEIQPGNTPKSQAAAIIKEYFSRQFQGDDAMLYQIKTIQEHQVIFAIPGSCQFAGQGVSKVVQSTSKQVQKRPSDKYQDPY